MGGEMRTVIYATTPSEPHNHSSLLWVCRSNGPGRPRPRLPVHVRLYRTFVSFMSKQHADVGVEVKWPNKPKSQKIPSDCNQSPSVPDNQAKARQHHGPFPAPPP